MGYIAPDSYDIDQAYQLTIEDDFRLALHMEEVLRLANCICNKPDRWFAAFGRKFPFIPANPEVIENGEIRALTCPACGKIWGDILPHGS